MAVVFLVANWRVFLKSTIKYSFTYKEDSFIWNLLIIHWAKKNHPSTKVLFFNIVLVLVSNHESEDRKSHSRLEAIDQKTEILDLVSKHETERQKFSISSRSMRLKGRNSRSRLEAWDWQAEILDLVSKHETERKKFSISSRELKHGSRYALPCERVSESVSES